MVCVTDDGTGVEAEKKENATESRRPLHALFGGFVQEDYSLLTNSLIEKDSAVKSAKRFLKFLKSSS